MKKLNYTCNIDPINYDYAAQDTMKHLYFRDYKMLKDVKFTNDSINWADVIGVCGIIIAILSIIGILFVGV